DRGQAVGGICHRRIFSAVDQMAVNLVLILERGLAKTAFPPQRNKKNRDVKHAPFPELLASVYRRGITVVSGGAAGAGTGCNRAQRE
ncbi:hypothetical protein KUCAC02_017670, partial [Chaenocephalus aceratus]